MKIIEKNLDKVDWELLSQNKGAIHLLEKNQDKIDWGYLSSNPNAIGLLERNLDKIDWVQLSKNPNAIHLIKNNLDKPIDFEYLSGNPSIFELDYGFLKGRMDIIREELMMKAWHPSRVIKWIEEGFDLE
ncbi:MAG: hypothetical protein EBS41_08475 [Actinobacteria bacterium]|nr:hypothetical protein [Actinomycetota bacterium]